MAVVVVAADTVVDRAVHMVDSGGLRIAVAAGAAAVFHSSVETDCTSIADNLENTEAEESRDIENQKWEKGMHPGEGVVLGCTIDTVVAVMTSGMEAEKHQVAAGLDTVAGHIVDS